MLSALLVDVGGTLWPDRPTAQAAADRSLEYWRDFTDLGIAHRVDAVVTSLDIGFRKPHPAFFEVAVREAGCEPTRCIMIGNSEVNDIQPTVALGIRAMPVAIEESPQHQPPRTRWHPAWMMHSRW